MFNGVLCAFVCPLAKETSFCESQPISKEFQLGSSNFCIKCKKKTYDRVMWMHLENWHAVNLCGASLQEPEGGVDAHLVESALIMLHNLGNASLSLFVSSDIRPVSLVVSQFALCLLSVGWVKSTCV